MHPRWCRISSIKCIMSSLWSVRLFQMLFHADSACLRGHHVSLVNRTPIFIPPFFATLFREFIKPVWPLWKTWPTSSFWLLKSQGMTGCPYWRMNLNLRSKILWCSWLIQRAKLFSLTRDDYPNRLPSLKLTACSWTWMVVRWNLLSGPGLFSPGAFAVSFRVLLSSLGRNSSTPSTFTPVFLVISQVQPLKLFGRETWNVGSLESDGWLGWLLVSRWDAWFHERSLNTYPQPPKGSKLMGVGVPLFLQHP